MNTSYQLFEFVLTLKPSEHTLSLLIASASYMLHVISRLNTLSTGDNEWPWGEERYKVFSVIKEQLRSWIVKRQVIGGSMLGGSAPSYGGSLSTWKGKKELQVW